MLMFYSHYNVFYSFNVGRDIRCQISFIDMLKEIQSYLLKFIDTTMNLYVYVKKFHCVTSLLNSTFLFLDSIWTYISGDLNSTSI